jgi:hypothetical protein
VEALSFTDTSLRVNACITLTLIGVHETQLSKALNSLIQRLSDPQSIVRFYAAVTLGRMEDDARPAIAELVTRSKDQASWEIRRAAAYALGKAGKATREHPMDMRAANALISLFAGAYPDRCAEVRLTAVMALGGMGIPPLPQDKNTVIQALNHATKDRYKAVAIWAHMGLMADGEPRTDHLSAIAKFLSGKVTTKDKDAFEAHLQAIRALGVMKKEAKSEIPSLLKELQATEDAEPLLIASAAWALGEMGNDAEQAVPLLNDLMDKKDLDPAVKNAAKDALEKINGKAKAKN